jgi:uncharacterized membrane protein
LGISLALVLSGLFLTINAVQWTSAGTGQRILERAVAILTDIDAMLPRLQQELREAAATAAGDTVRVPDFPIPVELPKEEAATIGGGELRRLLLATSAQRAYEEGMDVFATADPDAQRDIEVISAAGVIDRGLGLISEDSHTRFLIAAGVLGLLASLLAALLLMAIRSYARLIAAGAIVSAATLPSLTAAVSIRFAFRSAQEEADPFVNGLLDLGVDAMWVPIRNYIALAALGAALVALGVALLWASPRWAASRGADGVEG